MDNYDMNKSNKINLINYSNVQKNPLLDRIYDSGKGEKFNDLTNNVMKPKEYRAFITADETDWNFHNISKKTAAKTNQSQLQSVDKQTQNKRKVGDIDNKEIVTEKVSLLNKKFNTKIKEPVFDSEIETTEKISKNIQELESITGFKIMNQLPPSRGTRYASQNPLFERFKTTKKDSDFLETKTVNFKVPMEPKLSRPTTTIIALDKYAQSKTKTNGENKANQDQNANTNQMTQEDKTLLTINNMMSNDKKEMVTKEDNDEDQYLNSINKFIREAFEGKDYRINFVYYLPSDKENFYDLRQTTFQNINKERVYYTLSAKGLTVYIDKTPREFIKLSEWIIERQGYNFISQINFFKNFKIWRILKIWRKNIFRQKKIAYQNELANMLLFNNIDYNEKICLHKMYCNKILKLKILDLRVSLESIPFDIFITKQHQCRDALKKGLDEIHKSCETIFVEGIKKIFNNVQRKINMQNNESNYNNEDNPANKKKNKKFANFNSNKTGKQLNENKDNDNQDDDRQDKDKNIIDENAILNDDNIVGFENYPYKYKMMIKNECMNFIKLAYIFDYIILDVLRRMYLFSMTETLKKLEEFNLFLTPDIIRENILNKREEYVKPTINNPNRIIPYLLIKCKLDNKSIEKRDRIIQKQKEFFVKATPDDEFDPTAHLILEQDEAEQLALNKERQRKDNRDTSTKDLGNLLKEAQEVALPTRKDGNREIEIDVEIIERPHYYFTSYEPDNESLVKEFVTQINKTVEDLKVKGWRAHPRFKKYLIYLEDWDDRFGDWDNDEPQELDPTLILSEDDLFINKDELIQDKIIVAYKKCDTFLMKFNSYLQLHWKQLSIKKEYLLEEQLKDADEMFRLLFYFIEKNIKTLQRWVPFEEEIGMIKLTLEENLRKDLIIKQSSIIEYLKPLMPAILKERANKIEKWFTEMYRKVQGSIDSEVLYLEKTEAKEVLDALFYIIERKLNTLDSIFSLLRGKGFEITSEDIKNVENINTLKYQLKIAWDELNDNLVKNKEKLRNMVVTSSIPSLIRDTEHIESLITDEKFVSYDSETSKSLIPLYISELEKYENMYKTIKRNAKNYNDFLRVLGEPEYNFDKVQMVFDNLIILKNLWNALKNFDLECDEWKKTKFAEINTQEIFSKVDDYYLIGKRAEMQFSENGSAIKELLTNVKNFKESMQVIDDLNCPNLKPHHWERIQCLFSEDTKRLDTKDYQLEFLLEIRAYEHQKQIHEISMEAINWDILNIKIKDIEADRKAIAFSIEAYKEYYIVTAFDKTIEKIEECQSKVNNVLASRYVRFFKEKVNEMKNDFDGGLEMIEDMKVFQKKWMYLENILNGGDMKKKIVENGFDKIDIEWKAVMTKIKDIPNVHVTYHRMKKQDFFQKNIEKLEEIQQKIEEQLKAMRNDFERFYFISNDDLLYMLAKSTSTSAIDDIKPYLIKIFEDVSDLKVMNIVGSANTKEIVAIISSSKEEFVFEKNFEKRSIKLTDKLEEWLKALESLILTTLKEKMSLGYISYVDVTKDPYAHETWLEKITLNKEGKESSNKDNVQTTANISQVIATVTHVMFCDNTENAILSQATESNSLQTWYKKIETAIKNYARMVNKDFSGHRNMRRIISNLITHHVHYLEICKNLCIEEPTDTTDFIWQQQLRASFVSNSEINNPDMRQLEKSIVVRIKQLKSDMEYGYEYIGPSTRVVITNLTDRVWLTMTSALHIKLGCSLGGPAGTGKTETTKDLAKFFGIQCIVFNCSEQIDYKILGNIFSGLCLHKQGAYACLDEFNRINVEVLSVVASQLLNIRLGLLSPIVPGEKRMVTVLSPIELVGKLGVFITMNPTYSGRAELPDNLKSLFRPITMMQPDFLVIAEVKLYSEGFSDSKNLAKKLTKIYSLASQQLSQQDHYDFTLRTVGSVLSIAGTLKRQSWVKPGSDREKKDEESILITALRDANFPKFVQDDIQLFKALISDLFPDNDLSEPSMKEFEDEIRLVIKTQKLHCNEFTVKKCIQLFDIINIRLGICLTGPAGTGKSTILELVEKAMTRLRSRASYVGLVNTRQSISVDLRFKDVKKWVINPKSITMGELYGQENEDTKTFIFGIATKKIKKALSQESELNYRWVVLDGPIDTKWIENMNSVLDDSMVLCLSNGERIKLKSHIKIFFEVEDLSQASLATVSRLGIVYLSSGELGWRPYCFSWIKKFLPDETILNLEMKNYLKQLFEDKVPDAIENLEDLKPYIFIKPVMVQCVASLCNFLEIYLIKENGFIGKDTPNLEHPDVVSKLKKKLVSVFALALVWGIFGCVNNKGFHKIESFIRNKFNEIKMENSQLIMEHYFDFQKNDYVKYSTETTPFVYIKDTPYFSIFVPTIDTLRYTSLFDSLIKIQKNVFVTGETGVGKTAIILNILRKLADTEEWTNIQLNFSAQTSSEDTQKGIESKLDKKKGKKILFGKGGKKLSIFIDDINMPEANDWGAHPPIELLRQYLDQGGMYDRPKFFWKKIEDTGMVVSGGPPTGGRSKLTERFVRHFNLICMPQPTKQVLLSIFENILKGFLNANVFSDPVKKLSIDTSLASIELYEYICETMKPIPAKFHYLFNLRDVSKVFQGLLMIESRYIQTGDGFLRLWIHECMRVFGDRLINETDQRALQDQIVFLVKNKFKMITWSYDSIFKQSPLYYGEIHRGDVPSRPYEEIKDIKDLNKKLDYFLEMYNKTNKKNSISMVFFDYAVMHILRITRILRQPRGNTVLIGHGGTGKQTLSKFASFIMGCQFCTFSPGREYKQNTFRKDIKDFITSAGGLRKKTVLLLTDNNVVANFILEDINNLLNNGEIANLYEAQTELPAVLNNLTDYMRANNIPETREFYYETFVSQTRENLHIIFCTSPVGETLRIRFRKFPSLVNCCALNWFSNWPQEALVSCCKRSYSLLDYPDKTKETLVKLSTQVHQDIEELTERYYSELSRRVYVTPKSFLDMNNLFLEILKKKKSEIDRKIKQLADGVKKLNKTHSDIIKVEEDLRILEPKIIKNKEEAEIYYQKVKEQNVELESRTILIRDKTNQVTAAYTKLKKITNQIEIERTEIDRDLSEVWQEVRDQINKESLAILGKTKLVNEERRIIVEACVFVLKQKKITGSAEMATALQQEREKILNIKDEIDSGKIPDSILNEFYVYIHETIPKIFANIGNKPGEDLLTLEEKIEKKTSMTLKALYVWGKGMLKYWELDRKLQPIKASIAVREKEKEDMDKELALLTSEFKLLQENAQKLENELSKITRDIEELNRDKTKNFLRKTNAGKLVGLLAEEGERWKDQLARLQDDMNNFLGNMFLSTVCISYLSPFTGVYRRSQIQEWIYLCSSNAISVSQDFNLENTLSDPVEIRNWNISGLPSDSVSVQNGIMLFNNPKYALMIDPQLQANQWLKKLLRVHKLKVYKGEAKDDLFKKQLEQISIDIMKGTPVLIENVGETIDGIYNSLISKMTFEDMGNISIEFNSQKIEFNPLFRIYFTTKLTNPHYPPEYFIKLNIINFTVTFQGLTEQLLSEVFKSERRDKFEERDSIIQEVGNFNLELMKLSNDILQKLADANEETILDDESLIETLQNSKNISDQVKMKMRDNILIERDINMIRDEYIPVASRGSVLYFVIVDMGLIDPMYQFSLEYFKKIFAKSIDKAKQEDNVKNRVKILVKSITEDIYRNIKRGVFESHKTILSFFIAIYIKKTARLIEEDEWSLFLKGPISFDKSELPENPDKSYFSDFSWDTLLYLEKRYKFDGISNFICNNVKEYKEFFDKIENFDEFESTKGKKLFEMYNDSLTDNNFIKLLLIKIFRPDKVLTFVKKFIVCELGEFFVDTSPPKLEEIYNESDHKTPIIFILSQGADPTNTLLDFKDRYIIETEEGPKHPEIILISLGQGQGEHAKRAITETAIKTGQWVILLNCHLYETWMPELANIVQSLQQYEFDDINHNFRLWLTSMPNKAFPVSILQNSLKLTTEPPSGIKANAKKIYDDITDEKLNQSKKVDKFPKIMFALSMFHAVIQERKKFGPIGFNLRYDFNQTDYDTSIKLVNIYLDEIEGDFVPWNSILYLVGEVNYGGRITDDWDRITMTCTLNKFLNERLFPESLDPEDRQEADLQDYKFSNSGKYYCPHYNQVAGYHQYINSLPIFDEPDIFGLHENANIIYQLQESEKILNSLLLVIPKTKSDGKSDNVLELVNLLITSKPEIIDKREQKHKSHDKVFENGLPHSLTIVLYQEIEKFNRLITKISTSLEDLKNAIEGTNSMSSEGDEIYSSLLINRIPIAWAKVCYPSNKPLMSWFNDLTERIEFMRTWLSNGNPSVFWISGLFFPQGFITGVLQNHARETKIPISDITFKFTILDKFKDDIVKGPQVGVYIHGIFLEAGSWDIKSGTLVDQKPGERNYKMPVIWLETVKELKKTENDELEEEDENENENVTNFYYYSCPLFKTPKRTGIISASGRSDNHVINIELPSKENKDFWIMRGTALICQLDD